CSSDLLADDCRHSRDVDLALDLAGASRIAFEVGRHDLDVRGGTASALRITGRACASSEAELDGMKVEQSRRGDTLVVRLDARSGSGWSLFGNRQASFHLAAALPSDIPVSLEVGSGDANVTGVHSLDADVGSGDLDASRIAGEVVVGVGSGDIELEDVGAL